MTLLKFLHDADSAFIEEMHPIAVYEMRGWRFIETEDVKSGRKGLIAIQKEAGIGSIEGRVAEDGSVEITFPRQGGVI